VNKDNQNKYINLRNKFKTFTYESFNYSEFSDHWVIGFEFWLGNKINFNPKIKIIKNKHYVNLSRIDEFEQFIFTIGLIELISYWKAACPPKIIVKPFHLKPEQIRFWKKIYYHGLGEFFYLNGIQSRLDDFVTIESESKLEFVKSQIHVVENKVIVPIGGGKDSVVTLELLKEKYSVVPFIMNPRQASLGTAKAAGFDDDEILIVNRKIDPALLDLNQKGFLNGHTPFSALLGFVSIFIAALSGSKYIALSNESSANEPTVATGENHQYSKSFEFESDFRSYVSKNLNEDIEYFSFLRPLSEYNIANLFSKLTHHHKIFKSCNAGSKTDSWCCHCSKCLFTNIILAPFLSLEQRVQIFGKDLFKDTGLQKYFDELTGLADEKPFECVGTIDEVNLALYKTIQYSDRPLPYLLENFRSSDVLKGFQVNESVKKITQLDKDHFLTKDFLKILKSALND